MKIFTKITGAIVLALLLTTNANAQKNFKKEADQAFDNHSFFSAIELYKKAYQKENDKAEKARILFQTAECYRLINDTKQSESYYDKAIKAKYPNPVTHLYLADARKINEKYDEALTSYQEYQKLMPSDPRGADGAKSCEQAAKWKNDPTRHKIDNMVMINSDKYDFSPTFQDKKRTELLFTSTRESATGGVDPNTGQIYSDIFETKMDKNGKWSTPTPLGAEINTINNEGTTTITSKGDEMYFSRCLNEKKKKLTCQLYVSTKRGRGWGDPKLINFCIDSFSYNGPAISPDEKYMVFASNLMPGGFGGKDLWITYYDKKSRSWGAPVNLGPGINTPGDEVFPFVREDHKLYFSSNGHIGMGGLDLFSADVKSQSETKMEWANVTNLKYPLNSPGDDFAIIYEGVEERGYFTSNRTGGKGMDDIYAFYLPPLVFEIKGIVTDCDTKAPVENADVKLVGSDGSSVELKTDATGTYRFAENGSDRYVKPNTSYVITVTVNGQTKSQTAKRGYLNAAEKAKETTVGLTEPTVFEHNFCLKAKSDEIKLPLILYEYDKADLMIAPGINSKDSLNFLYNILVANPTIVIELGSHTDTRGSDKYNEKLSQRRAQTCVDYLVKEKGIPADRIVAKGYGETKPKITDAEINAMKTKEEQEAGHQQNRRTAFRILREDYGLPAGGAAK